LCWRSEGPLRAQETDAATSIDVSYGFYVRDKCNHFWKAPIVETFWMKEHQVSTELGRSVADSATFGDRLKAAREASGMTQSDLSRSLSISQEALERWESNQSEPRANRLQMIAGLLGVSFSWLLMGDGEGPEDGQERSFSPEVSNFLNELRTQRVELSETSHRLGLLEKRLRNSAKGMSNSESDLNLDDLDPKLEKTEGLAQEIVLRSELEAVCSYIDEVSADVRQYLEKIAVQVTHENQKNSGAHSPIGTKF
jgi:HTH-type transcriptional regulator, cell division transcriptional repressor